MLVLRDFYCDVLGFTVGPRPPFRSTGFWLYAAGAPVLHLVAAAPGSEPLPEVSQRRSAADHLAFRCSDLEGTLERLRQHGVAYRVDEVPLLNETQIFLHDPAGMGVELNFPNAG